MRPLSPPAPCPTAWIAHAKKPWIAGSRGPPACHTGPVDGLGYACALALGAVFVRAAGAKLARPATTAAGFAALGVPAAAALARTVPVVELLAAMALVTTPRVGAGAGLLFLAAFSWVLVRSLRSGARALQLLRHGSHRAGVAGRPRPQRAARRPGPPQPHRRRPHRPGLGGRPQWWWHAADSPGWPACGACHGPVPAPPAGVTPRRTRHENDRPAGARAPANAVRTSRSKGR